jgi:outer membrane protein insertion porin family
LEKDVRRIDQYLNLKGYLRPRVDLMRIHEWDSSENSIDVSFFVLPRKLTPITFVKDTIPEDIRQNLPIYRSEVPGKHSLDETARYIRDYLDREGLYRSFVEVQTENPRAPEKIDISIEKGKRYKISQLKFQGNIYLSRERLENLISTRSSKQMKSLTRTGIETEQERIKLFYQESGFLNVRVSYEFEELPNDELAVLFKIEENERFYVNSLKIQGNDFFSESRIREELRFASGEPFSPLGLSGGQAGLTAIYRNAGFKNVQVRAEYRLNETNSVDVMYFIEEGSQYFNNDYVVVGAKRTKRETIDKQILGQNGEPFSFEKNLESENNLYDLAVFDLVEVNEIPSGKGEDKITRLFSLEESRRLTLIYGIGYSHSFGSTASEGVRGTFGVTDANFLGGARPISLSGRFSRRRQRASLSYTIPKPLDRPLPTLVSLAADNEKRLEIGDDQSILTLRGRPYDSFRIIASSQTEKRLSRRESLFFRYSFERVRNTIPEDLQIPLEYFREQEKLRLSSVALSYLSESRDDAFDPHEGFFVKGDTKLALKALGSQEQFFQFLAQGVYSLPLNENATFVSSLRLGFIEPFGDSRNSLVSNPIPISERFFSGGPTTLRGIPIDLAGPLLLDEEGNPILVNQGTAEKPDMVPVPEGGNALAIVNVELRFPRNRLIGGALFYDIGNVFPSITNYSGRINQAAGIGIYVRTPIGPIRIDAAYNPDPPDIPGFKRWLFHLNFGHPF